MIQMDYKYKICTRCFTYNQAAYIEDALNGFAAQETTCPVVTLIVDDASTDGETEVIRNYLKEHFQEPYLEEETDYAYIIGAYHKINKNCNFVVFLLKYNHKSIKKDKLAYLSEWLNNTKYIALCEGDDYWIDSKKLQKQSDFMDLHLEHSLCFCANQRLFPTGETIFDKRYENDVEICPMKDIILGSGSYMATNSMFFRRSMYVPYTTWVNNCPVGDLPMMLTLSNNGLVGYLADVMCVYRVAATGSWTTRMSSNRKSRQNHYHAIIRMWHQFDNWTERKYHKIVLQVIHNTRVNHWIGELRAIKNCLIHR